MPRVSIDIDAHREEITRFIKDDKLTQPQIIAWLQTEHNIKCTTATLQRRLTRWGIARRAPPATPELISEIGHYFRTTLDDNEEIANSLNRRGFNTNVSQVKTIRLQQGWRHRRRDPEEREKQSKSSYEQIQQALREGTVPERGREKIQARLREVYGVRATEADVRKALKDFKEWKEFGAG